jgi:ferredoxin-NADP reductase
MPVATHWQTATVVGARQETPTARTLVLDVPDWPGHRPGQHLDVRLTAEDGYQAQRSYSIASPPERPNLELVVELLMSGEVSPWLARIAEPGDELEVRGPIGGPFSWTVGDGGPLLLVGGGSGVAPLLAMLRHRRAAGAEDTIPARVVVSARRRHDLIAAEELESYGAEVTLTRETPADWTGATGRVSATLLGHADPGARCFVCGPTGFVEHVTRRLVRLGHPPARIHAERFGPTG